MTVVSWVRVGIWGILAAACGSTPPPQSAAVTTEAPKAAASSAADPDAGPIDEVPAPKELFLVGRVSEPAKLVDTVSTWLNVPVSVQALVEKEMPLLGGLLRYDAPVDVAAALDPEALSSPEPLLAVSLPVTDYHAVVDKLRASGKRLERVSRGRQYVSLGMDAHCIVARANGPAAARLVCGDARKDVDLLAPYMVSRMPSEALTTDAAYFELRAEPVRARFGKKAHMMKVGIPIFLREVSLGNPRFDSAVAEAAHATVADTLALIQDLDRVVVRVKQQPQPESLDVELGIVLRSQTAWVSQTLGASVADNDKPPGMFWQLPADAEFASYSVRDSDPQRFAPILKSISEMAGGALEHFDLATPKFERLMDAFANISSVTGPTVHAQGPGLSPLVEPDAPYSEVFSTLAQLPSYTLSGIDDSEGHYATLVERFVDAYNDAAWRKRVPKDSPASPLRTAPKISQRAAPASWGLPPGSKLMELSLPGKWLEEFDLAKPTNRKSTTPSLEFAAVIAKQGSQTWLAYGADAELVGKKVQEVISVKNGVPRPELAALGSRSALSGAFWSILSIVDGAGRYTLRDSENGMNREQLLLAMPNKAKTPVIVQLESKADGPAVWLTMTVERKAAEDLAAAFVMLAAQGM